ncbi:MAG: PAS domain S-box protein, partial [Verrucomicrobiota bacterium]
LSCFANYTTCPALLSPRQILSVAMTPTPKIGPCVRTLQQSDAQFRSFFEHSPDAIFVETLTGDVLDVNAAACRLHGLRREELIGMNVVDLVPADQRDRVRQSFPDLAHAAGRTLEGKSLHADGRIMSVELRVNCLDYAGQPALLLHVRDITDRKLAEEQLRQVETRYRTLVEQLPAITYVAEFGAGQWIYVSPQIETLLGFGVAEWTAETSPWLDHIHPDDRPQVLAVEAECRATGAEFVAEYRMLAHDGRVVWFSDHAVVMRDAVGQPQLLHGVMFDISARKGMEDQLRQSHKMDAVGRLAGGVAHDFNNILTTIMGYSELILRRTTGDARVRDNAQEIKKAADRAASLTRQLLAFSRKQALQPQVLDLNSVVAEMDKMLRRLIGETIDFELQAATGVWRVKADPGQVQQVIMNLAVNARDAMPSGGTLTIETANVVLDEAYVRQHPDARVGEHVLVAVSDTGGGMSAEVRAHLFEPFFTTKGLGNGTGLGLATCYGIVKQSGGHINVYSELGHGTVFKVYLPRVLEHSAVPVTEVPPTAPPGGRERVLLVEDEAPVRELSALVLRELGYTVVEASDGDEALRLTKDNPAGGFDLLFTDVVMPRMGGKELAYWFRVAHPATRVLFTSGYPDKSVVHNGELLAGIAFLHKPYTPQLLAHKIRAVLDN